MGHGGRRPGAGRPKGSKDGTGSRAARIELTKQIAAKAAEEGVMPLEVMLTAMRQAWAEADREKAVAYAEKAAPYMHPKLASVQHSGDKDNPLETHTRIEMVVVDAADADDTSADSPQASAAH